MSSPSSSAPADASTSSRSSPESRPTTPAIGGRSLAKVPWPRRRLARRRGGSAGSSCGMTFFPRILVGIVGLHRRVVQRIAVQVDPGVLLEAMPQSQQVLAVAAQLAGHPGRRGPLGDAVEDHQDLRGAALGALERGPGPGVEDAAAGAALVI